MHAQFFSQSFIYEANRMTGFSFRRTKCYHVASVTHSIIKCHTIQYALIPSKNHQKERWRDVLMYMSVRVYESVKAEESGLDRRMLQFCFSIEQSKFIFTPNFILHRATLWKLLQIKWLITRNSREFPSRSHPFVICVTSCDARSWASK